MTKTDVEQVVRVLAKEGWILWRDVRVATDDAFARLSKNDQEAADEMEA